MPAFKNQVSRLQKKKIIRVVSKIMAKVIQADSFEMVWENMRIVLKRIQLKDGDRFRKRSMEHRFVCIKF